MTTPGPDTPGPADESAAPGAPARRVRRRLVVGLVALAVVVLLLGVVAVVVLGQDRDETNPLSADAPGLTEFTIRPFTEDCRYEPARGGLVAHFDVSTSDAGRFTVDVEAVTDEGMDDLDISTPHVVRFTVPFYGGRTRKQFDVVVPLTEADYRDGYRKCRYIANGTE
jgi:hypothetical protein